MGVQFKIGRGLFCRTGLAGMEIKFEVGGVEDPFEVVDIPPRN